ncbi:MAG: Gldg family protein [Planctomycetota bacterium]
MAVERATNASQRRLVFGFNVVLQALLVTVLAIGVVWLSGHFKLRSDLTRTGVNSLSPRTVAMLRGLDQNVHITAVFPEPDKERDQLGEKRYRELQDLLELYDADGGARVNTRFVDPTVEKTKAEQMLARLRELPAYADEARPHREALDRFPGMNEQVNALVTSEYQRLEELTAGDARLERDRNINQVKNYLRAILQGAGEINEDIQALVESEVPRYGSAVRQVREYLTEIRDVLGAVRDWMKGGALKITELTPEMRTFFLESPGRYEKLVAEIETLLEATRDLEDVKLEELYSQLTRWRSGPPLLVATDQEARVLPFWEVWRPPTNPGTPPSPDGDTREFVGEAAISSAILQLTRTDKTAVVFTRFGGPSPIRPDFSQMNPMTRQMPTAPFQALGELLEQSNFLIEDWDISEQKTPPVVAGAVRTIYVVFAPTPPPPANPMQPTPPAGMTEADRELLYEAIKASGMAIFLTGFAPPAPSPSPMLPPSPGTYDYAEYLKSTWGVDVKYNHLAWQFAPNPQKPGWWVPAIQRPMLMTDQAVLLTEHPISKPLQSEPGGFYLVSPVTVLGDEDRPAGVTVEVIAEVRPTEDVWAITDVMRLNDELRQNQGVRPGPEDVAAPFPIAVTATNEAGHKIVVFGSTEFAADMVTQAIGIVQRGNARVLEQFYPANTDLFINSMHWLSGEKERVSLGPRRGDVPRLRDLDAKWAARLPWFLVGIWPAVVLVLGVAVWLVRRR